MMYCGDFVPMDVKAAIVAIETMDWAACNQARYDEIADVEQSMLGWLTSSRRGRRTMTPKRNFEQSSSTGLQKGCNKDLVMVPWRSDGFEVLVDMKVMVMKAKKVMRLKERSRHDVRMNSQCKSGDEDRADVFDLLGFMHVSFHVS